MCMWHHKVRVSRQFFFLLKRQKKREMMDLFFNRTVRIWLGNCQSWRKELRLCYSLVDFIRLADLATVPRARCRYFGLTIWHSEAIIIIPCYLVIRSFFRIKVFCIPCANFGSSQVPKLYLRTHFTSEGFISSPRFLFVLRWIHNLSDICVTLRSVAQI